jgi:glycosyltransferase involved in cell wall biosynthesis
LYPEIGERKVVLFLSRLDRKKGLDLLVPALGRLARERHDFVFLIAGGGEKGFAEEVARLLRDQGIIDRTLLIGQVNGDSKWRLLQEADVFVLTSYQENFGLVVGEAMAAGRSMVISRAVNGAAELEELRAALVVDLNVEEIAGAIGRLLADESLRRRLGEQAARVAVERFGWERAAEATERMYEAVLRGAEAAGRAP